MPDQADCLGAQSLAKLDNADLPGVVCVHATDCVCQTVKTGCTIVLQALVRWTCIYLNINPVSDFEQLCKSIAGYSDSEDSILAWKQRVALFRKNSIAHIPPKAKID